MKFDPTTAKSGDVYKSRNHLPGNTVFVYVNKRNCLAVEGSDIRPYASQPPAWYVYSHNVLDQLIGLCANPRHTPA